MSLFASPGDPVIFKSIHYYYEKTLTYTEQESCKFFIWCTGQLESKTPILLGIIINPTCTKVKARQTSSLIS